MESKQYWINQSGKNIGPYNIDQIRVKEKSGELELDDPVCLVGGDEWSSVSELIGFDSLSEKEDVNKKSEKKIILAKSSGMSFNTLLTLILISLLFICGGLFLYLKSNMRSTNSNSSESVEEFKDEINIEEATLQAVLTKTLKLNLGLTVRGENNSPFSGWAQKKHLKGEILSTLIKYENGKKILGFSWKPNGEECPDTSLRNGKGILVEYFQTGAKKVEASYRDGLSNGIVRHWHKNGQIAKEESFVNGKLHGQSVFWHENGQKTKLVFYMEDMQSGPYSYWTKEGQKFDEGIYREGKLDGKRTLWSKDGMERTEEFYENGELIPKVPLVEPPLKKSMIDLPDKNPFLAILLNFAGNDESWQAKAHATHEIVEFIRKRFETSGIAGSEVFSELAVALFRYVKGNGGMIGEIENQISLIKNKWGISILFNEGNFALSELPEMVSLGSITWRKAEYAENFQGSLQGESRDLVVGDLKKLFSSVGLQLGTETDSITRQVERQIWDELSGTAEVAKSADIQFIKGELTFKASVEKKLKKINPQGKSIFETSQEEVVYSFSQQKARDQIIGPFLQVLDDASIKYEEMKNGALMIRTYSNLTIFSDQVSPGGNSFIYPNVTIKFAGVAPLNEDTLIRFIKVDPGLLIEEPSIE